MRALRAVTGGVVDFVVGDDPIVAVGVVVALGLTGGLAAAGLAVWWLLPLSVIVLLALSLARALRAAGEH